MLAADPSLTPRVIVDTPYWSGNGVSVTVGFAPLPPKIICAASIRFVFELAAESTSDAAGVSASPITKSIGPKATSCAVTIFVIAEIVGGELIEAVAMAVLFAAFTSGVLEETPAWFVQAPALAATA